jgi:hypothetical protein
MLSLLLKIYFDSVHTLCPVVDRVKFYQWFDHGHEDDHFTPFQRLLLDAMSFAAFQHVNSKQLGQSKFSSVHEGQKAFFDSAHCRYRLLCDKVDNRLELVQATLLLTIWAPSDSSPDINSFWLDRAIDHATKLGLPQSRIPGHRIVWWCCIVRNRVLALGLRRPHKLRCLPVPPPLTCADFTIVTSRAFTTYIKGNLLAAELFLAFCKLSDIIESVVKLRAQITTWDEWKTRGSIASPTFKLAEIMRTDNEMCQWEVDFQSLQTQCEALSTSRRLLASVLSIRLISQSVVLLGPTTVSSFFIFSAFKSQVLTYFGRYVGRLKLLSM